MYLFVVNKQDHFAGHSERPSHLCRYELVVTVSQLAKECNYTICTMMMQSGDEGMFVYVGQTSTTSLSGLCLGTTSKSVSIKHVTGVFCYIIRYV